MSDEVEGLGNIVSTDMQRTAERRRAYWERWEQWAEFYGYQPHKASRRERMRWKWRDLRRSIADRIYPEGRDGYDPYW